MALIEGTNCGFVTEAPTADPYGSAYVSDNKSIAGLFTSPATAAKIVEIGWYCDNATEEANFEVGLYSDEGNSEPETRLYVDDTNAKGTGAGWKTVSVDWSISGSTDYWLAVQLDNTATATNWNYTNPGNGAAYLNGSSTLPSDWGTSDETYASYGGIYAVWEAAAGGVTFGGIFGKALSGSLGGRGV